MKIFYQPFKDNRGDTIVEVLIAIAVVGLVLAGAFVSTNRSTKTTRTAQERGEALKLAESQLEQIKIAVDAGTALPASFCFDNTGTLKPTPPCTNGTVNYKQSISKSGNSYAIVVTWDGLVGRENNVRLDYRTQ